MPGQDVDRAAIAVVRKADLYRGLPAATMKDLDDSRSGASVCLVEQPIERCAAPDGPNIQRRTQRREAAVQIGEPQTGTTSTLQERNATAADAGSLGDFVLP